MNTNAKVDFFQRKITITKRFYRLAQNPGTPEFRMLLQLQRELPDYVIRLAEAPRRDNTRLYPTYEEMLRFIRMSGGNPKEFLEAKDKASRFMVPYNYVRQWFFKNYPMYDSDMCAA